MSKSLSQRAFSGGTTPPKNPRFHSCLFPDTCCSFGAGRVFAAGLLSCCLKAHLLCDKVSPALILPLAGPGTRLMRRTRPALPAIQIIQNMVNSPQINVACFCVAKIVLMSAWPQRRRPDSTKCWPALLFKGGSSII